MTTVLTSLRGISCLSCSVLVPQSCPTLCNPMYFIPPDSSVHGDSPGKNTGVGCHALLQEIFQTQVSSVQLLSCVRLFVTPWTIARQASLSITNSWSLLKLMSFESVMPSNHLILCHPLLLPPSIFPGIRVFSNESVLHIRWPKYWSFTFSISPSSEYPGLISFRIDWLELLAVQGFSRVFSNTTVQKHQFFGAQLSLQSNSHICT